MKILAGGIDALEIAFRDAQTGRCLDGSKVRVNFTERTIFFEPFGRTNYLYLGKHNALAQTGIYSFIITSRSKAAITIAVGEREIFGEAVRGAVPTPLPTPTPMPTSS